MTTIQFSGDAVFVIREITKELKEANKLKEAELRLKYGDNTYFKIREDMLKDLLKGQ